MYALVVGPALAQLAEEGVPGGLRAEGGEDGLGEVVGDDLMDGGREGVSRWSGLGKCLESDVEA